MRSMVVRFVAALALAAMVAAPVTAQVQFFNGEYDGNTGAANEINAINGVNAITFENFTVGAAGMTLTGIFGQFASNSELDPTWSTAFWEVRSGITAGNGGTLVLGGTSAASHTATGFTAFGGNVYQAMVSGMNLFLPGGEYWFGLAPVRSTRPQLYLTSASGSNGVNANLDQLYYTNSSTFGFAYRQNAAGATNFSIGVTGRLGEGSTVPEPATMTLLASGLVGIGAARRKRRSA